MRFEIILWCLFFCKGIHAQFILSHLKRGRVCDTGGGVLGTCEEASKCLAEEGVLERNGYSAKVCSVVEGKALVCCRKPYAIAQKLCDAWSSYWRSNEGQCITKENLIVGGVEAKVGQFPHVARLGKETARKVTWLCGASLISPHFVMTAAHCHEGPGNYVVRLGDHDSYRKNRKLIDRVVGPVPPGLYRENDLHFETKTKSQVEQLIRVVEFIRHPDFKRDGLYNDIALLRLQQPAILTKRVLPACLPTNLDDFMNRNVTAVGWGKLKFTKRKSSRFLQKVSIPTIDNVVCWERLTKDNPKLIPEGITSDQLCAGENGKDACLGDSGGPIVIQRKNRKTPCEHTDVGVVSYGPGCGKYGIYTRVSSYVDWITSYIAPKLNIRF